MTGGIYSRAMAQMKKTSSLQTFGSLSLRSLYLYKKRDDLGEEQRKEMKRCANIFKEKYETLENLQDPEAEIDDSKSFGFFMGMVDYFSKDEMKNLYEDLEVADEVTDAILEGDGVPEEKVKEAIETVKEYADTAEKRTEIDKRMAESVFTGGR